jgi:serine protease Do
MQTHVDKYRKLIVQIATPYNVGTGFYLPSHQLIVTNEHVVRDNCDVVVEGIVIPKQIVKVLYLDMRHDLAFLSMPRSEFSDWPELQWLDVESVQIGDEVMALSNPINKSPATAIGTVSDAELIQDKVRFIQHTADLNPANSGGPLMGSKGKFIGLNTFIAKKDKNIGFTLPNSYLKESLENFAQVDGKTAARCYNCSKMVFEHELKSKHYCPECGSNIQTPSIIPPYEPLGCAKTIEQILQELGHNVNLARRGPNNWGIIEGSAKISILYHEKTGLIIGDASLCNLPPTNIQPLYEYLLRQNYETEGLTFSIKGQDVVLSLLIYDRYLNAATGRQLFQYLFERADYYDNVLVEQYGATWK